MPNSKACLVLVILAPLVLSGCSQEDSVGTHSVVAGTSNKFFTAKSDREIKPTEGTTVVPIPGQDGKPIGYVLVARDNSTTGATCSGSCYNSEGNPCGGCAPQQGLPDSIITCGCEVSACAQSGGGCKLDQTNFGGVWSRALVAAPARETKQP
jgi:hypothetical protein